jgi:L-amino acid N-acyltransferase YncA
VACNHHNVSEVVLADATEADRPRLLEIFTDVVERGDGYPESAPLQPDRFAASWVDPPVVVVARHAGEVVGAYYLKPNFPGRAAHVANAGYVVARGHRGAGIGQRLVEDSITRAPAAGFDAIMFNLVFESNPARPLYERLGWREIGRVPRAVNDEPAVIYWRDV